LDFAYRLFYNSIASISETYPVFIPKKTALIKVKLFCLQLTRNSRIRTHIPPSFDTYHASHSQIQIGVEFESHPQIYALTVSSSPCMPRVRYYIVPSPEYLPVRVHMPNCSVFLQSAKFSSDKILRIGFLKLIKLIGCAKLMFPVRYPHTALQLGFCSINSSL
jgi:hypothetical protein